MPPADLFAQLMTGHLHYERFLVHGDDFGGSIATAWRGRHPSLVEALARQRVAGSGPADAASLTSDERVYLDALAAWREAERGYGHIAATRPQTLGSRSTTPRSASSRGSWTSS